ncbi:N-acetylmuramoyl-L-alanine amidase [Enterococcus mundtii]|uniref:SH3 domain-containing protein n=1 Tax=Enterococcus mundtii TaxID=53346 RepID=A0A848MXY3_ENTMU|nr:N-acetylmuramoyl-L-alanine amidase [Enterococcus mundtii]NMP58621.1 SH3 domain-containing protein [Enterococcus mundtii]
MATTIQDLRGDARILGPSNAKRDVSVVTNIARHHSATDTGDVFGFQEYWQGTLGWGTGGYHEIILRDGTVQWCYFDEDVTNGVAGHNTPTYHICLVGNGNFTEQQEQAFYDRARAAMERFNLTYLNVLGHNEFTNNATECPGTDMNVVRNILAGGDGNVTEPEYIIQDWNKEMVVAADVLNVRKNPNTQSEILRQLTRGQVFQSDRVTLNGEVISGSANWFEVDGNGWVARSLIAESSVDNEWREESGVVTVAISGGINLRGPSASGDITNPTILPIIRRVDQDEAFTYDKILIQKNGHAFVRQSLNEGYAWLAVGPTSNGVVTTYWVSGIEI